MFISVCERAVSVYMEPGRGCVAMVTAVTSSQKPPELDRPSRRDGSLILIAVEWRQRLASQTAEIRPARVLSV